jgi:ATP-binding cassette subfamily B protein
VPPRKRLEILTLLKPHRAKLFLGLLAAIGEGIANLLDPWPIKIIFDYVLRTRQNTGWLHDLLNSTVGLDKLVLLKTAAIAALVIAVFGAFCSYAEKSLTTTVGQWVMHDLRKMLYAHIQRLSLSFHDEKPTGDLISRVTSDIDSVQSFVTSGLLNVLINCLTLFGMIGVMFYLNWQFTLIALSVAPPLFLIVFRYTRMIKKSSREVRKKEGEIVSLIQEVFSSIRVVKAFAR